MARPRHPYIKLAGRGLRRNNGVTAARCCLWLGPDHLLSVDFTVATEEYRRFYYRDIEAIIIRRTINGVVANCLLATAALLSAVPLFLAWLSSHETGQLAASISLAVFWGLLLIYNTVLGATCQTHIRTAAQLDRLPSLGRVSGSRKALARLRPLIAAAQGETSPEAVAAGPWSA